MHPYLNTAIKAARRAGQILNRAALELAHMQSTSSRPNDFVMQIDQNVKQTLIEIIQTAYPQHGIVGATADADNDDIQWLMDPLNGITNFVHGFPHYAVSIVVLEQNIPTNAVIYDPSSNELFSATRGSGAFLNDRRIRVSTRTNLQEALISIGQGSHTPTLTAQLHRRTTVRQIGSIALDLAYVASGRLDACCDTKRSDAELLAGSLLVLEGGGLVADHQGTEAYLKTGEIVCGCPKVFAQLLNVLQNMDPPPAH